MSFGRPSRKREPLDEPALFDYAVESLGRRMRTVRDLKRLMRMRAAEGEAGELVIDAVILRLKKLRYLDDTRFAADYTRLRQENEKFGRRRVQQDLMQRGVHSEIISKTLDTAYEDVDEPELLRRYIARKRLKEPEGDRETRAKQTARLMRMLVRAGFSTPSIYKVLRKWKVPEETLANLDQMEEADEAAARESQE
jgi:regulatory protein